MRGRDHAAEDEQQQEGEDREGDQLGLGQVLLVWSLTSLKLGAKPPIETSRPLRLDDRLRVLGDDAALVLDVLVVEVDGDDERAPSRAISCGAGAAVAQRVDDPADVLDVRPTSRLSRSTSRRTAGLVGLERAAAGIADDQDDARVGVVAERLASGPVARSLSEAVSVKPAALQVASRRRCRTRPRGRRTTPTAREHELRVLPGQVGDAGEHSGGTVPDFKAGALEFKLRCYHRHMGRREYGQPCSLASALDKIGERWSLLIVRELMLGPLRFSELGRGGRRRPHRRPHQAAARPRGRPASSAGSSSSRPPRAPPTS